MLKLFFCFESSPSPAMIYLGLRKDLSPLTISDVVPYTVLWKFTQISYTRVDCMNEEFDIGTEWCATHCGAPTYAWKR
eukprot:3588578-Prymnesium_polylepis.1